MSSGRTRISTLRPTSIPCSSCTSWVPSADCSLFSSTCRCRDQLTLAHELGHEPRRGPMVEGTGAIPLMMRPSHITPTRSARPKASAWSWVTRIALMFSCFSIFLTFGRWTGEARRRGWRTPRPSAAASAWAPPGRTRCCSPPDSEYGIRFSYPAIRTGSSPTRWFRSRRLAPQPECDVARDVEMREQREVLEHHAAVPAFGLDNGSRVDRVRPSIEMAPVTGRSKPAIPRSRVDFPHPLGPSRQPISPGSSENVASVTTVLPPYRGRVRQASAWGGSSGNRRHLLLGPRLVAHAAQQDHRADPDGTIISEGTDASASRSSEASS